MAGEKHNALQKLFLAWALNQERTKIKGGICGDQMGLGKTHQMIGLLGLSQMFTPADKPTLLLVPSTIKEKMVDKFHNELGDGWDVYAYGAHYQYPLQKTASVILDDGSAPWTRGNAGKSVVVMSYTDCSYYGVNGEKDVSHLAQFSMLYHKPGRSFLATSRRYLSC